MHQGRKERGLFDSLASAVQLLLSALGVIATSDLGSIGALGVTVAVLSTALLLTSLLTTLTLPDAGRSSPADPARAIDISSPLSQSDPDASGHPRPRAPGFAATAA